MEHAVRPARPLHAARESTACVSLAGSEQSGIGGNVDKEVAQLNELRLDTPAKSTSNVDWPSCRIRERKASMGAA